MLLCPPQEIVDAGLDLGKPHTFGHIGQDEVIVWFFFENNLNKFNIHDPKRLKGFREISRAQVLAEKSKVVEPFTTPPLPLILLPAVTGEVRKGRRPCLYPCAGAWHRKT